MTSLRWKEGEGYDIHVLRGVDDQHKAPDSKALDQSFEEDPNFPQAQFPLGFVARFKGAPDAHGVKVNTVTGVVTATASSAQPKMRNFLVTARQDLGGGNTVETVIRLHVHDSVQKIWLTPSTLTVRSPEARFTVLALFDDGVVGDITGWPELAYQSSDASVSVANTGDPDPLHPDPVTLGGEITILTPGNSASIAVSLKLTTPPTNLSAMANVVGKTSWGNAGTNSKVMFVGGPTAPSPGDVEPGSPSNVQAVLRNAPNVLFLAEGFRKEQKADFDKMVRAVLKEFRTNEYLSPFKELRDSINFWSVFVQSEEDVISILGDQAMNPRALPVALPRKPAPTAVEWGIENMIHEAGLPAPTEASAPDATAWIASRQALYDLPSSVQISAQAFQEWNALRSRSLLNERNTAFGLAHYDRPRASGQDQSEWRLMLASRRTSSNSLQMFVGNLTFGKDPTTSTPIEIGATWRENPTVPRSGKDKGLICLLTRDEVRGGTWMPPGKTLEYFAANAGASGFARVTAAQNGLDIQSLPERGLFSTSVLAANVARGCAHALGLGDEYGNAEGTVESRVVMGFNLQAQDTRVLTSAPGATPRVIDATKINWLWPRIVKAGVIETQFDPNGRLLSPQKCDPNGTPNPSGTHLRIRLSLLPEQDFVKKDLVRMRASVNLNPNWPFWAPPSADPFAAFALFVETILTEDEIVDIVVGYQNPIPSQLGYLAPSGTELDLTAISALVQYSLIAPRMDGANESRLVVDAIRMHIDSTDSPLNAPPGSQGAACAPGSPPFGRVTPTNLPQGPKIYPYPLSNTIGIYDGGGHSDCGVFRPAGRCRMRDEFGATMPFCHVCSYIMVDIADPTKHGELDKRFPEVRA